MCDQFASRAKWAPLVKKTKAKAAVRRRAAEPDLPFAESIGYQIRATHRSLQRLLQLKIEPHGVTLGMWYFRRALWHEDGLNQRDSPAASAPWSRPQ
jgi:MarR family transcriptional regulator, organic hydroperoxide resistance regulator